MTKKILYTLLLFSLCACHFNNKESNEASNKQYKLEATNKIKKIPLDEETRYNGYYLYYFIDKGNEYLSFLNYRTNQLLFYDFKTCELLFKIELAAEGPDGVGQVSGYYVQDLDNIYVSSYIYPYLIKIDTMGRIIQKINYGKTESGYTIVPSYTPSAYHRLVPFFIDNTMYITQKATPHIYDLNQTPLTVSIDTINKQCHEYPLTYSILGKELLEIGHYNFGREFDGKYFIYSFNINEEIIVASIDHKDVRKIKVKSQYINNATKKQALDVEKGPRENLELARYGDVIYDKYREVYYRFAYPAVELDRKINWFRHGVFGRKAFSIIILDKDFNIIGETLFPESIYNSYVYFVHTNGLYISKDYQINFEQSEDFMTFELFKLTNK